MPFDPTTTPLNVTTTALPGGSFPTFADLAADPVEGDGVYADGTGTGYAFGGFEFVLLDDLGQAFYDRDADRWVPGAYPPVMPLSGSVVADLTTLRSMLGAPSTGDDDNLDRALSSAAEYVYERTMHCDWDHPDVQYAILLLSTRLYSRRKTPEGVAGFQNEGLVVRIAANDPDINRLMERHIEYRLAGIG